MVTRYEGRGNPDRVSTQENEFIFALTGENPRVDSRRTTTARQFFQRVWSNRDIVWIGLFQITEGNNKHYSMYLAKNKRVDNFPWVGLQEAFNDLKGAFYPVGINYAFDISSYSKNSNLNTPESLRVENSKKDLLERHKGSSVILMKSTPLAR